MRCLRLPWASRPGLWLLSLGFAVLACRDAPKPVLQDTVAWRPLATWSGHNLMQTEAFISDTGSLRITWETKNEAAPGQGTFTVTLHSGVSGRSLLEAVQHKGAGRDVAYVTEDPREFFLVIDASGLDWTVAVAEAVPARITPSVNR